MPVPLGHHHNSEIVNEGIDTVTGELATTAGPYASGNPVVHPSHPKANAAMQANKTGPYADEIDNELPPEEEEVPVEVLPAAPDQNTGKLTNPDGSPVTGLNIPNNPTT